MLLLLSSTLVVVMVAEVSVVLVVIGVVVIVVAGVVVVAAGPSDINVFVVIGAALDLVSRAGAVVVEVAMVIAVAFALM